MALRMKANQCVGLARWISLLGDFAVACQRRDRSSAKPRGFVRTERWGGGSPRLLGCDPGFWIGQCRANRTVTRPNLQLELVQALAVVGSATKSHSPRHLVDSRAGEAKVKPSTALMMPKTVARRSAGAAGTAHGAVLAAMTLKPFGLGFLHPPGLGRAEVVAQPTARRPGRHQASMSLSASAKQTSRRRWHSRCPPAPSRQPAENGRDRNAMSATSSLRSLAQLVTRAPTDQLRAPGIHHARLSVIRPGGTRAACQAHQPAVRSLRLLCSSARGVSSGGFGCLPSGPAGAASRGWRHGLAS